MDKPGNAVHFGAGALGRGLVIPRLFAAGWGVSLVDADAALVSKLAEFRGYPLTIASHTASDTMTVPVDGAYLPSDSKGLGAIAAASLITTAVRRENLGRVAATLVSAWKINGMPEKVAVVACENVEHVDVVVADAFAAAGLPPELNARLVIPRTVVDRICAARWPETLEVVTESFNELAIGRDRPIAGIDQVADIDAAFARKRYLVNSFADASAILGSARGHATLSAAVSDPQVQRRLTPLLDALIDHLVAAFGFRRDDLDSYLATSRMRLANGAIPRRIDTVARDFWRKLSPTERFGEPLIALQARGALGDDVVGVMAGIVRAAAGPSTTSVAPAHADAVLTEAGMAFYARLEAALRR